MANIGRYSWINAINAGGIQYLHEPRQYIELCSIACKNNYSLSDRNRVRLYSSGEVCFQKVSSYSYTQ